MDKIIKQHVSMAAGIVLLLGAFEVIAAENDSDSELSPDPGYSKSDSYSDESEASSYEENGIKPRKSKKKNEGDFFKTSATRRSPSPSRTGVKIDENLKQKNLERRKALCRVRAKKYEYADPQNVGISSTKILNTSASKRSPAPSKQVHYEDQL